MAPIISMLSLEPISEILVFQTWRPYGEEKRVDGCKHTEFWQTQYDSRQAHLMYAMENGDCVLCIPETVQGMLVFRLQLEVLNN
jgi:hypothetical protein